ncbi:MAG: 50S ribosomal protein L4, partial [Clostridia bacterium]|nr:50S ribosomal protein L4 [Clostridia bacterium]
MLNVNVYNMKGEVCGSMELSEKIFGAEVNSSVLHTVVRAYLLNQRQGTQSTLTRAEVSGGGRKPWRQKGTGRARQGSTRSPQWIHGGIALGPKPRTYKVSVNKKVKRAALYSALSSKVASGELIVVDNIALEAYKTKEMVNMFNALGCQKEVNKNYKENGEKKSHNVVVPQKALLLLENVDEKVVKSCSNIETVKTTLVNTLNVYEILNCEKVVATNAAIEKLEEVYA